MSQACLTSLFPDFSGVLDLSLAFPNIQIPSLPTPLFPQIQIPSLEAVAKAMHAQAASLFSILKTLADKIIGILGISLDAIFPKIPILNVNLMDIFGGGGDLIQTIKGFILNQPIVASILSTYAKLPMYFELNIPDFNALQIYDSLINQYLIGAMTAVFGFVNQIADMFKLGALSLPLPFPTMAEILDMIKSFSGASSLEGIFEKMKSAGLQLQDVFMAVAASLGSVLVLPKPWFSNLTIPEIEFQQMFNTFINNLLSGNYIKKIVDFVLSVLGSVMPVNFSFLCFPSTTG